MSYTKTWNESVNYHFDSDKQDRQISPPGNWVTYGTAHTKSSVKLTMSKSGQSVPDWRERISKGLFAASPYTLSASRLTVSPGATEARYSQGNYETRHVFSGLVYSPAPVGSSVFPVTVSNKALSRTLGRVRSEYEHFNLLPSIAELRQTIRQFGAPASAIISLSNRHMNKLHLAYRGLSGSTSFKKIAWHRIVSSSYLEYAFGLRPLLEDTKSLAEALARWSGEGEDEKLFTPFKEIRASATSESKSQTLSPWVTPFPGWNRVQTQEQVITHTEFGVRYYCRLKRSVNAAYGSNERLLQLVGLNNPLNWIPTLWEVLPWSWLYDYFLNIQEIIEAGVTTTSGIDWIIRTQRAKYTKESITRHSLVEGLPPKAHWVTSPDSNPGRYVSVRTDLSRSLPDSLGLPSLVVSFPNSVTKLTNMTAAFFARRAHAQSLWLF